MKPLKKFFMKVVGIGCIVLVSFILLEMGVRLFGIAPKIAHGLDLYTEDKYLPYMTRPSFSTYVDLRNAEASFLCTHNSRGLRDREHDDSAQPGTLRILGLGDSFTYGIGASFQDTFLYRLEELLNARQGEHPHVEIIKAGIPGTNTQHQRVFLEHYGLAYRPNIVLVGFNTTDVIGMHTGFNHSKATADHRLSVFAPNALTESFRFLYVHSHVFRILLEKLFYAISSNFTEHWSEIYQANGFHEKNWVKVEDELSKIRELCRQSNAVMVVVEIPENSFPTGSGSKNYSGNRLAAWCKKHDAFFVDVLPRFMNTGNMAGLYWKDGHCNAAGYRLIAQTIYDQLVTDNVIP